MLSASSLVEQVRKIGSGTEVGFFAIGIDRGFELVESPNKAVKARHVIAFIIDGESDRMGSACDPVSFD